MMMTSTAAKEKETALLRDVLARHTDVPGALLPILHALQDALGHIPSDAVSEIAIALNLSRAEVYGVITYYPDFRIEPALGRVVKICLAEACQSMGADALAKHAQAQLECPMGGHSRDGAFSLEPVYCLGLCALSPAICLGDDLHARMTLKRFDVLLAKLRSNPEAETP